MKAKKNAGKAPSVLSVIEERFEFEGRGEEHKQRVKERLNELGGELRHHLKARWDTAHAMGHGKPDEEWLLYRQRHGIPEEKTWAAKERELLVAQTQHDLTGAMEKIPGLPATAPANIELEWVGSHPAIMRADSNPENPGHTIITDDDVLRPPNGPAPSRRAVNALLHWANNTNEFHKQLITELKKVVPKPEEEEEAEVVEPSVPDDRLMEVREILKAMRGE